MGISYGPSIATSGLIFHYDMGNTSKSFKGKPTTNYNPDPFFSDIPTHWDYFGFGDTNTIATSTDYLPAIGSGVIAKMTVDTGQTAATLVHRDPSGWGNLTNGDQVTVSFYVRGVANSVGKLVHIHGFANSAGGAISTGTDNSFNDVNIGTLTSEWKRYSHTFTWTDAVNNSYTDQFYGYVRVEGLSAGDVFYASNPQTEKNSFATPFVDGTRSNTQAIVDLTGSVTATAGSSLVYNADNTFSFDASSNSHINLGDYDIPTQRTVEVWFKSSTTNQTDNYPGLVAKDTDSSIGSLFLGGNLTSDIIRWGADGIVTATYSTTDLEDPSQYFHYVGTYDASGTDALKLYRNSVLVATGSSTNAPVANDNNLYIGSRVNSSLGFTGDIPIVRIYNRALSQAEVTQNFNASRARFGI